MARGNAKGTPDDASRLSPMILVYVVYIGTNSLQSASIGKLNLSNAEHRDPDRSAQPARRLLSSDFAGFGWR